MEYCIGDIVKLKKKHPCGSCEWTIIRTGADLKLRCNNCKRVVMIDYQDFLKQIVGYERINDQK